MSHTKFLFFQIKTFEKRKKNCTNNNNEIGFRNDKNENLLGMNEFSLQNKAKTLKEICIRCKCIDSISSVVQESVVDEWFDAIYEIRVGQLGNHTHTQSTNALCIRIKIIPITILFFLIQSNKTTISNSFNQTPKKKK